jgi:hypothetical protein
MSIKQDRGVYSRTPIDTERKYNKTIKTTSEKVEEFERDFTIDETLSATSTNAIANNVVTNALATKVSAIEGMGLSENNFTTAYKQQIETNAVNTHTHSNKTVLDSITEASIAKWNADFISSNITTEAGHIWFKNSVLIQWGTGTEPTYSITFDTLIFSTVSDTKWFAIGIKEEVK